MELTKHSHAGTLQSNDCLIRLSPCGEGIILCVDSPVKYEFGDQIEKIIRSILREHEIFCCRVDMEDRGALDCTIRARMNTAIRRAL